MVLAQGTAQSWGWLCGHGALSQPQPVLAWIPMSCCLWDPWSLCSRTNPPSKASSRCKALREGINLNFGASNGAAALKYPRDSGQASFLNPFCRILNFKQFLMHCWEALTNSCRLRDGEFCCWAGSSFPGIPASSLQRLLPSCSSSDPPGTREWFCYSSNCENRRNPSPLF